ncbi:MAG: hypothetical protein GF401_18900 [Chitinivibrionales bacterium]|nr:hypothetical protein [Chitinivibrionales bacterium]
MPHKRIRMLNKIAQNPFIKFIVSLRLTVICLIVLSILTFWGTLYQVDHGLYPARARFFNSWVLFIWNFIPFPGTKLVIAVLSLNLIGSFFFRLRFAWKKIGILLVHFGIVFLFLAAGFTHYFASESYLSLHEGEQSRYSSSYRNWELLLYRTNKGNIKDEKSESFDLSSLTSGSRLIFPESQIGVTVRKIYTNAAAPGGFDNPRSMHRHSSVDSLVELEPEKDPSKNVPGIICTVERQSSKQHTELMLHGRTKNSFTFEDNDYSYALILQPKRILLPLTLRLLDFTKEDYAGTEMARDFKSRIYAKGDNIDREVVISMNRPFRYNDFTFFQSSYSQQGRRESSTFAVVRNSARQLPYIASCLIMAGLLIHFLIKLIGGMKPVHRKKKD